MHILRDGNIFYETASRLNVLPLVSEVRSKISVFPSFDIFFSNLKNK